MRARLQPIPVSPRGLGTYEGLVPERQIARARQLGGRLAGVGVLYVSSAPPEASDSSASLAALLRGLGVEAERALLHGDAEFVATAADVADAMRGSEWALAEGEWRAVREACEAAAVEFDARRFDAVVVHGAGPAPLIEGRRGGGAWLWRTGVDASSSGEDAREALRPLLGDYRELGFALPAFVPPGVGGPRLRVIPPAFDPALRERPGPRGPWPRRVDPSRPLLCHLGRLDAWADPLGAVEAWRLARHEVPGLQLAIAGRVDPSDPEATGILEEVSEFAEGEEDLHLLTDRDGVGPGGVEAVTTLARCAMRCSVGDEFDPEISASQWRGTPLVGAGAGFETQVRDGEGGFVAADPEAQAVRIAAIVGGPRRALQVARAGRDRVLRDFSIVRLLGDELDSLERVLAGTGAAGEERAARRRGRVGAAA